MILTSNSLSRCILGVNLKFSTSTENGGCQSYTNYKKKFTEPYLPTFANIIILRDNQYEQKDSQPGEAESCKGQFSLRMAVFSQCMPMGLEILLLSVQIQELQEAE